MLESGLVNRFVVHAQHCRVLADVVSEYLGRVRGRHEDAGHPDFSKVLINLLVREFNYLHPVLMRHLEVNQHYTYRIGVNNSLVGDCIVDQPFHRVNCHLSIRAKFAVFDQTEVLKMLLEDLHDNQLVLRNNNFAAGQWLNDFRFFSLQAELQRLITWEFARKVL